MSSFTEEQLAELNNLLDQKMDKTGGNIQHTEFSTQLSGNGLKFVVESQDNGTDWYRLYNDGWLECGGYFPYELSATRTKTFLKEFQDAPKSITCSPCISADTTNNTTYVVLIHTLTSTSLTISCMSVVGNSPNTVSGESIYYTCYGWVKSSTSGEVN